MDHKERFASQLKGDSEFEVIKRKDLEVLKAKARSADALMTAVTIIRLKCKSEVEVRRQGGDLVWSIIKDLKDIGL